MIRGEKIILRTIRESDLDILYNLVSDISSLGEYVPIDLKSQSAFKKDFEESGFYEKNKGTLLICLSDRIIGITTFIPAHHYDGLELGYILFDTDSRNKGYGTEALQLLSRYLFMTRNINRLQLSIISGNIPSKRIADKCGFSFEGLARGAMFHRGKHLDLETYSCLRSEIESVY